jgi:hypothetical protein
MPTPIAFFSTLALNPTSIFSGVRPSIPVAFATHNATATGSVQPIAGTLMAAIREPEKLKEREYFNYLQNAYKWNYVDKQFELYTKNAEGVEAVLVYAPSVPAKK